MSNQNFTQYNMTTLQQSMNYQKSLIILQLMQNRSFMTYLKNYFQQVNQSLISNLHLFNHMSMKFTYNIFINFHQIRFFNFQKISLQQQLFRPLQIQTPTYQNIEHFNHQQLQQSQNESPINQGSSTSGQYNTQQLIQYQLDNSEILPVSQFQGINQLTILKNRPMKLQIQQILEEIIIKYGIDNQYLVQRKNHFTQLSPSLGNIYDLLMLKYQTQTKSKAEIIKYIMRKVFRFLFKSLQSSKEKSISLQEAHKVCLLHYFPTEEMQEEMCILPFRNTSNFKTMNFQFLLRVFQCQAFQNDYSIFLNNIDNIIALDNNQKMTNISQIISNLLNDDQLFVNSQNEYKQKIRTMRRLPWSQFNLEEVKRVAYQLREFKGPRHKKFIIRQSDKCNKI